MDNSPWGFDRRARGLLGAEPVNDFETVTITIY